MSLTAANAPAFRTSPINSLRSLVVFLLLVFCFLSGCRPPGHGADPERARASIAFAPHPDGILRWDLRVRGLPAIDNATDQVIVAELSHGFIASSLSLSLFWLRANESLPVRTLTVLDGHDASHVLYELDEPQASAEAARLAARVQACTREANEILGLARLRPVTPCDLHPRADGGPCGHPQRLACGGFVAFFAGDQLVWQSGTETGKTTLRWSLAPMAIGEGPAKEMLTCLEEAYFDPIGRRLIALAGHACKAGGGDACQIPATWRVAVLR